LDTHFDRINICLWTKFEMIFNNHISSFSKVNVKNIKLINTGLHPITVRFVEFLGMIKLLCKDTIPLMLQLRIKNINQEFIKYCSLLTQAKLSNKKEEDSVFFINNLYYIITKLHNFESITSQEDPQSYTKIFNNKIETYIYILFNDYFGSMTNLINKCVANLEIMNVSVRDPNKSMMDPNELTINKGVIDSLNKQVFVTTANDFNTNFRNKLNEIKKSIFNVIINDDNSKFIYRKFLEELILKYSNFMEILRAANCDEIINSIISAHKLMIEINTLIKNC